MSRRYFWILLGLMLCQCHTQKKSSFTFGSGFPAVEQPAGTLTAHAPAPVPSDNFTDSLVEAVEALELKGTLYRAAIKHGLRHIPEARAIKLLRMSQAGVKKHKPASPQKTQENVLLGVLFLSIFLFGFFYLAFWVLTRIGWISLPFWKALLGFIAFLIFLYAFMHY